MRNAKKATPPSAKPPITRRSRDDRIAPSGMGPEISEPTIQVPATRNPMTKKRVEPDGARNVAASKTDPTTSVPTTVRDRRRPWSTLPLIASGFAPARYGNSAEGRLIEQLGLGYAHEADFLRLDILLAHGGVYADMDTLFVREYPDPWFEESFAIGEENAPPATGRTTAYNGRRGRRRP